MAPIKFIDSSELSNKNQFYVQWPAGGRAIEDGQNDELVFEDISNATAIPTNGNYFSRIDQNTVIIAQEKFKLGYKTENQEIVEEDVESGQNAVVPAGVEFSIIGNDVKVLNRQTHAVGTLPPVAVPNQLPSDFAAGKIVNLVDASSVGAVLTKNRENHVDFANFPGSNTNASNVGILENTFNMEWQDVDGKRQVHFVGTGGVLTGGEGNPGVVLAGDKEIHVNLLLKRIDGSFYLDANQDFLMVTAESNTTNGDPNPETLKIAKFPASGVKLPIGFWHSVPFPVPGDSKLFLNEFVVKTNANSVINVAGETGSPLKIHL
ncbi:unnamed protein product [Caenorhabditis angaria]|uniref:Uncharacterized protein n=1 Tax=Caenorhabditis angaria TaxID=860376 RepID=A0A9P1J3E0_9PELO|nr:unnamed protein product [Caenorhabditis angaria]